MVLIPKGGGYYWGIGLVEAIFKVCAMVRNAILKKEVDIHDSLNGFQEGKGLGTETSEAKLDQHLSGLDHEPMFQVFLDGSNVYYSRDRGR